MSDLGNNDGLSDDLFHSSEDVKTITADKTPNTMQTIRNSSSTASITPLLDDKDSASTPLTAGDEGHASLDEPNVEMKKRKRSAGDGGHASLAEPDVETKKCKRSAEDEGQQRVASGRTIISPNNHMVQRRTLLKKLGWPLARAATLVEFVHAIKDAVCGTNPLYNSNSIAELMHSVDHKRLYLRGILHCDVSNGNILIFSMASNVRETKGRLIDLDNAEITKSYTRPTIFRERWNTKERLELNKLTLKFEFSVANIEVEPDVFQVFEKLMQSDIQDNYNARGWVSFACTMMEVLGIKRVRAVCLSPDI